MSTQALVQRIVATHQLRQDHWSEIYNGIPMKRPWFVCSCGHKERMEPDGKVEWERYQVEVLNVKPQRDLFEEARLRHLLNVLSDESTIEIMETL